MGFGVMSRLLRRFLLCWLRVWIWGLGWWARGLLLLVGLVCFMWLSRMWVGRRRRGRARWLVGPLVIRKVNGRGRAVAGCVLPVVGGVCMWVWLVWGKRCPI